MRVKFKDMLKTTDGHSLVLTKTLVYKKSTILKYHCYDEGCEQTFSVKF